MLQAFTGPEEIGLSTEILVFNLYSIAILFSMIPGKHKH